MTKKKSTRRTQARKKNFLTQPAVQFAIVAVAVLAVVFIILTNSGNNGNGLAKEISVDQAYQMYQQGDTYFLDVRTVEEWNDYHAPNTTLIPLDELASRVNEVPKDKPVVVVCRSGNRSQSGRDILLNAGFTNVTSMTGGLSTWHDRGYPVTSGP